MITSSDFNYRIFIHDSYYVPDPAKPEAPCNCDPNETLTDCYARTHLSTVAQIDIFNNADDRLNRVTNAEFENVFHPRYGDHCSGGILPEMRFEDDFASDTAILPVDNNPRYERGLAYIYNPPPPHPLQPSSCYYDNRNPGTKLFSQWHKTGDDTGWVGLVAATKGASFAKNGELEYLFFSSYRFPNPSVTDEGHLGDMWRSMMEYWLNTHLFDASGNFDLLDLYIKYSGDLSNHKYG